MRIGIKLLIALFPIFAIASYYTEHWLHLVPMLGFMAYMAGFSGLYIIYEVSAYFCFEKTNPDWVYKVSREDLQTIKEAIAKKRQ